MKNLKRPIAMMVAITFIWLLPISAMPLQAATPETGSQEQNPRMVEKVGQAEAQKAAAEKDSILPYALIGLGTAAVAAILIFVVFKTSYDITGTWAFVRIRTGEAPVNRTFIFTGTKKSGTLTVVEVAEIGTYTVDGKDVTFKQNNPFSGHEYTYTGKFDAKDKMSGSYTFVMGTFTSEGTWNAAKTAAAASLPPAVPLTNGIQDK